MLATAAFLTKSNAQEVGIKTNFAHWATASPNLGVEIGLGKKFTLDVSAGFNPFSFSHNRQWKHWIVQPELRWWTCEHFNGHFLAIHAIGGGFNVGNLSFFPFSMWDGLENNRYKGGAGYAHAWYDQYTGSEYSELVRSDANKNYWGITKLAISLVYLF